VALAASFGVTGGWGASVGTNPTFEGAGIAIDLTFTGAQPTLMLDRDKMKQVIINLCKNAHDAMPQGGRLTISGHQDPDQYFVLEFRDTGVGIPEGIDVFQLFTSTKSHGTGLGLPVVREIVSAHRGKIDYRSEPGKGTVFTILLPTA
jgi:signal transduction histidine kinase